MNTTPTPSCSFGNAACDVNISPPTFSELMSAEEKSHVIQIQVTRRIIIIFAIIILSPCLILAGALLYPHTTDITGKQFASHTDEVSSTQITEGNAGPWGRLLYAHLMIDIPDEFVRIPPPDEPIRWFFQDYTKERVISLFKSANLTQNQIEKYFPDAAWQTDFKGLYVTVSDKLILELTPEARSKIYAVLIAYPENDTMMDPVWFRPETIDKQLEDSGLSQSSIQLLKSLLYSNGSSLMIFSDRNAAVRQIKDEKEKRLFIKAISRKTTLMARLKIDADTDVESIARYWSVGGSHKDILPLMSSVQHIEGGWNLNIIYLLPHFIREHIYKYPFPSSDPNAIKQDCFWSAFNSLNMQPDNRLSDMDYIHKVLISDYYTISQPSQLGDIVLLCANDNEAMHAAVYLADDLVFTKNGFHFTQPWILMKTKDMLETYSVHLPPGQPIKMHYYRRKNL